MKKISIQVEYIKGIRSVSLEMNLDDSSFTESIVRESLATQTETIISHLKANNLFADEKPYINTSNVKIF